MPYFHRGYAAEKHKTASILCLLGCVLVSCGYLRLIEHVLRLPAVLSVPEPRVPVLVEAAPAVQKPAMHKGGRAALTAINYTPKSQVIPRTGQRLAQKSTQAGFKAKLTPVDKANLNRKLYIKSEVKRKVSAKNDKNAPRQFIGIKPGGSSVVLALLVDHEGVITRIKVLVPSKYPFMDMNYTLWLLGTRAGTPDPPIPPGQTRWIDMQLRYGSAHPKVALP